MFVAVLLRMSDYFFSNIDFVIGYFSGTGILD